MRSGWWMGLGLVGLLTLNGCGDSESGGAAAESGPVKAEAGMIVGKVTGQDGKPIDPANELTVNIGGVSSAGEKVYYTPAVKPDGTYKQKVVAGSYYFSRSFVKAKFKEATFDLALEPVGNLWNKSQDSSDPITQDFVWKTTGKKPDVDGNPNNDTHWYGMTIGMRFIGWREDTKKAAVAPPAGTKLSFVLKPLSKSLDGRELQTVTIERDWRPKDVTPNDNLNDLPVAEYELAGTATLPDGSTKPILLQGPGDYPAFKTAVKTKVEKDGIIGGIFNPPVGWVID